MHHPHPLDNSPRQERLTSRMDVQLLKTAQIPNPKKTQIKPAPPPHPQKHQLKISTLQQFDFIH